VANLLTETIEVDRYPFSRRIRDAARPRAWPIPALGQFSLDTVVVDDIAAVPVEQHAYLPMRRGQRARLAGNHYLKSAPINVASGIVNLSRGGMLPRSVARWFGAGKSLARL
jgi:hypothetical protein